MFNLFFGIVVDVQDTDKLNRLRVSIAGFTDNIPVDMLPWYYPFYGQNYLPIKGDTVPVFILNDNFTHGFYNNKIDLKALGLDGTEYENYVELYKRNGIQASYKESIGWEFINTKSSFTIDKEKIVAMVDGTSIIHTKDKINIGNDGPAVALGNKTVEALQKQLELTEKMYESCMELFDAIKSASTPGPLKPIKAVLTAMIPLMKKKHTPTVKANNKYNSEIQSKKVFIE